MTKTLNEKWGGGGRALIRFGGRGKEWIGVESRERFAYGPWGDSLKIIVESGRNDKKISHLNRESEVCVVNFLFKITDEFIKII